MMAAAVASAVLAGCARPKVVAGKVSRVETSKFALRVNAGISSDYTDKAGNVWKPDKEYTKGGGYGFVGGLTVDRGADMKIEGTNDPRISQTEHYSMTGFVAEVPNGKYTVRLHFAETYDGITAVGGRVFGVTIQGKPVLNDFDVFATAGGAQKAVIRELKGIEVSDGKLEIGFVAKTQNPEINGIEILGE
jgi:hypothetical protein